MTDAAPPSQEDVDRFNSAVQGIIDRKAREGETVTWENASIMFNNYLKNIAENPKLLEEQPSVEEISETSQDHESRITVLEQQVHRLLNQ